MANFEFDPDTDFGGHIPEEPEKKRGGRPPGGGRKPKAQKPPGAPSVPVVPSAPVDAQKPKRKTGMPRTGRWPQRKYAGVKRRPIGHEWAMSDRWMPIFLAQIKEHGNIGTACDVARVSRSLVLKRKQENAAFREEWDDAAARACDDLRQEILRRATKGDPVYYVHKDGGLVEIGRKYSDILAIFAMKQMDPTYRDNYQPDQAQAGDVAAKVLMQFLGIVKEAVEANSLPPPEPQLAIDVTPEEPPDAD